MTNKEKYIDKESAKTAAETLGNVLWNYYAKRKIGNFKDVLYEWLSQEAEEETASPIMSKALMKVDERMAKLEQRINENRSRIEKLEMANWLKEV